MSDSTSRCWLVERTFGDRNLVTLVYATPDGSRYQRRQRSSTALRTGTPVTAAVAVPDADLESVDDAATRDRYAAEADRVARAFDPDDPI
ncbi:hypothetical protein [Natrarchaeobaculum sulfurireducens]|uniref:DUF7967 domain-containing protein n=1 Tax=Natrarchaeobaculum sulfurireducens TaxID=2044521 RepID=A0A346PUR9_9EURY|nr:hypothetical protein [Natrarchaeobaculum sulfurireducens]AXR79497.1 hypothetical protein AArc1_3192 [Natrarchaeobaculum sulfurireducens]AXR83264.1 hypothetical protein AArcMg_3280 [Natrarchaeobaculum sulfurireducens]